MVRVTEELALSPEHATLYYANDPLLGHLPVLIFHGPSTTANYTANSSRIQVHVFSPAGFQSFPRITISPNSPFYGVVSHLPREFQGDEVCRGLAFGLFKYFAELPEVVKNHLKNQYPTTRGRRPGSAPALFGEQHAADLAKAMVKAENTAETVQILQHALQTQHISNVDIDLVLPPGSITPLGPDELEEVPEDEDDILDPTLRQYGMYTPLVKLWGEPVFLPTSRLRRAPSKPSSLNRSKSFTKDQKMELRVKLSELMETEERYVHKLNELVKHIADEFRQSAKSRAAGSSSPTEEEIEKLFPRSADRILQLNSAFMQELRKAMDDSEEDALRDIESQVPLLGARLGGPARAKDPSGALAVARIFLEWFPRFTDSYQDYIRASQHFPQLLNSFLDRQSSFRQRVAQTGEQTMRSILIEPVQRLPRYSLLIDQIVGCLPITHPALQLMLRARDIIANICSMDDPLEDKPHVTNRLRNMIECWPLDLEPQGRLILAADFVELAAPYVAGPNSLDIQDRAGIFLLFSDCIVILKKMSPNGLTGRDLLREIDKPSPAGLLASMTHAAGGSGSFDAAFTGWHNLADVRFSESADGRLVWMTSTQEMKGAHAGEYVTSKAVTSRCFVLQESFEGKAARWSEDVVKARIEARFPEAERETPTWTLRSVSMPDSNMGLHAAVFQEGAVQLIEGRREPAPIRVVIDNDKGTKSAPVGHYGVEIVVEMRAGDLRRVRMNTLGLNGKVYTDDIALEDFLPTLSRRVIQLLSSQFNVANLRLAPALVSYYTKIIRGLNCSSRIERPRSFLATSPVKLLSSFLGGGTVTDITSKAQRTPVATVFPPPPLSRSTTQEKASSFTDSIRSRDRMAIDDDRPENPLVRLEQTFTGYIACLQSRKGQFMGRTLLNRSAADELSVNDLYNRLIENPFDWEASSDLGPEVVFVAFEKFVRIAWRDQMGPIMTLKTLDLLQERASRRVVGDFGDFVNYIFGDMAPQNRRAFIALIKLLADLLDGCGNDGDRGALTLAFAELLVDDGSAHNYINLLDRLVEDCDRIFDDTSFGSSLQFKGSGYESLSSTTRSHKSATGSMTSNTSSLRRKLGFDTLLRQNSKDERERPSVWRSLSKHGRNPATGESASLSKASVNRSRSIDMGYPAGPNKLRRPGSRDRPPVAGAFDDIITRPASSHRLETIGEPGEGSEQKSLKKKRRSSLSDLKSLMAAATLEDKPLMPLNITKQTSEKFNSAPRIPAPSKIPISPQSQTLRSPSGLPAGLRSPRQKENVAEVFQKMPTPPQPARSPEKRAHSKTLSSSNIPTLKLSSRPRSGSESPVRPTTSPTKGSSSTTQKLRLQSPQKLRERLQTEKSAVDEVDVSLKTELSRIAEDMARVNGGSGSGGGGLPPRSAASVATQDLRQLTAAVRALEERVPREMRELSERMAAVQRDTDAALRASEAKVKAVDQLYREATAENELLYEKFNSELGKIVKALRGKGREDKEELVARLKEQTEEAARAKKENARLRREMVSLRTLLKGGDS
ncbi:Rho guanine nucleotide exchange factor gef2 [Pleurostoma richardsiae]|uniref:Rho guanine nucleotide exchange factor gef2 n=1 Tax=Pleurostoma richardsiae TaxID=41990 RepID=A0AA38VJI6_9PEZI|nr:Rho guanine nucleotide exchange factor gef2 [Pleurostoma richardsiae]